MIEGTLSADSSNIVQLVKAQYQAITSSIEMKDNSTGSVKVRWFVRPNGKLTA